MATVRLNQATDMSDLPNGMLFGTLDFDTSEIDRAYPTGQGPTFQMFGNFTLVNGALTGPVSVFAFDNIDFGSLPNFVISDLAYNLTSDAYNNLVTEGHVFDLVTGMLSGADTVIGTSQPDTLLGFGGDDILIGGGGGDGLLGGAGSDTASYSTAPAGLFAGLEDAGFNTGDALGDTYFDIANLEGSAFDDILYGNDAVNRLSGGAGDDVLVGKGAGDAFFGSSGTDAVSYDASPAVKADLLHPTANTGEALGDTYSSIEGLEGGAFDDILFGNNSANAVRGNGYPALTSGNDSLYGRGGSDTLEGYDGNDRLDGGTGVDTMKGGTGNDLYFVDDAGDAVVELASEGTADRVYASVDYVLSGLNVEILSTDSVAGTAAIDLTGNAQANTLYGNAGNNILNGRGGSDTLKGYGGADSFAFRDVLGATNVDTISDFSVADDTIRLENAIFDAIAGTGTLTAGQFAANTSGTAQDSDDRIVYETDTGKLFYDINGNAAGGSIWFGRLNSGLALTNADFFIS